MLLMNRLAAWATLMVIVVLTVVPPSLRPQTAVPARRLGARGVGRRGTSAATGVCIRAALGHTEVTAAVPSWQNRRPVESIL